MEAEKRKGQLGDEMLKRQNPETLQLQQQVAHSEELLLLHAEKENSRVHHVQMGKISLD